MMNNRDKLLKTMFDEGAKQESTALAISYLADRSGVGKNTWADSIELESKGFVASLNKEDLFTGKVSKHLYLTDAGVTRVNAHKPQPQPQPQGSSATCSYVVFDKGTFNIRSVDSDLDILTKHTHEQVKETGITREIYRLVKIGEIQPVFTTQWVAA